MLYLCYFNRKKMFNLDSYWYIFHRLYKLPHIPYSHMFFLMLLQYNRFTCNTSNKSLIDNVFMRKYWA